LKKTSTAPNNTATTPAKLAHRSHCRNDAWAAATICAAEEGYCCAMSTALENDLVSSLWTLSDPVFPDEEMAAPAADAYPAVSRAPNMDCMMVPPRSRWRSAVPDDIPTRRTGTELVRECEAGVPARPTPIPTRL
jgi:hypothetical protein